MKKLLLVLLCFPLLFTTCKKEEENNSPTTSGTPTIDVIVDKKWWLSTVNGVTYSGAPSGFLLNSDEKYYHIAECQELLQDGKWDIEYSGFYYDTILLNHQYFDTIYQFGAPYLDTIVEAIGRVTEFSSSSLTLVNDVNFNEYVFISSFEERCTYIPDDNFEQALINLEYDNVLDDYVTTATIDTVTVLSVGSQNISDLTGIEDFASLVSLNCDDNQITNLNVSQNIALTTLYCNFNPLTSLDVSGSTALIRLVLEGNQLTNLDISNNILLEWLVSNNFKGQELNLSENVNLEIFVCHNCSQLEILDLRNTNNMNQSIFEISNAPNLSCINVDDAAWSTANWTDIDPQHYFSENCP